MKQVQIRKFGRPQDAVHIVNMPTPVVKAADEVLVHVQLAPVGPADIGTLWGRYPRPYPDSLVPGVEAIGVIEEVGSEIGDLHVGDRVLAIRFDCWSEFMVLKREQVVKVSAKTDMLQQCNLKVNGCTAARLLSDVVELQTGDWVVQNAANSTVGQYLIQIARQRGIKTLNIVRTESAAAHVRQLGGDAVLIDGSDMAATIRDTVNSAPIKLAIDCVGGSASDSLADALVEGGTLVVYGGLAGQPVQVSPLRYITKDIHVRGFWITRWLKSAPYADIQKLIQELDEGVARGQLTTEVAGLYPLVDIAVALEAAGAGGRNGKVVLDFREHY